MTDNQSIVDAEHSGIHSMYNQANRLLRGCTAVDAPSTVVRHELGKRVWCTFHWVLLFRLVLFLHLCLFPQFLFKGGP